MEMVTAQEHHLSAVPLLVTSPTTPTATTVTPMPNQAPLPAQQHIEVMVAMITTAHLAKPNAVALITLPTTLALGIQLKIDA